MCISAGDLGDDRCLPPRRASYRRGQAQAAGKDFEGHPVVERHLAGREDDAHAATAYLPDDREVAQPWVHPWSLTRFGSAEENVDFFRTYYGPTLRAFESPGPPRRESLRNDLLAPARRYDRNGGRGPIAVSADYLATVIVRR